MTIIENGAEFLDRQSVYAKLIILSVIILIICGVYWYFFWLPKSDELISARNELQKERTKLNEYENIAKELPRFEQEFNKLDREFKEAASKLPEEKEIPSLIDNIYAAVSASGLESNTFAPKPEVKKDIYAEIPIDMRVYGSYYDLANFFDRVSKLPRIVNIRDLNLIQDKRRSTGNKIVLDASFTAVTFRLIPHAPPQPKKIGVQNVEPE
ncbi:MAG: pilus assembly protein PilO [Candidatus Dadabacteria bacterium]